MFEHQRRNESSLALEIGRFCAITSQPHSIANGDALWRLLRYAAANGPLKECHGPAIKAAQSVDATKLKDKIYRLLKGKNVTVAVDGWTDVNKTKVHNVVILHDGIAYYIKGIFLPKQQSTAINMAPHVGVVIDELLEHDIRVTAIATDNAKVMWRLYDLLVVHYPWLVQVKCAAHTLQLIVNYMLQQPVARKITNDLFATLAFFFSNSALQSELYKIQPDGKKLELKRSVPTRWSSFLYSLQRFIQLKEWIIKVLATTERKNIHSDQWWSDAVTLESLLHPFQIQTDMIQADSATMYTASSGFHSLNSFLIDFQNNPINKSLRAVAKAGIEKMQGDWFNEYCTSNATRFCTIIVHTVLRHCPLLIDQKKMIAEEIDGSSHQAALKWFYEWAVNYHIRWCGRSADHDSLLHRIKEQYGDWCRQVKGFEEFTADIHKRLEKTNC